MKESKMDHLSFNSELLDLCSALLRKTDAKNAVAVRATRRLLLAIGRKSDRASVRTKDDLVTDRVICSGMLPDTSRDIL